MSTSNLLDQKTQALKFMLAGKATFTFKSLKSGKHFTYKITAPKDKDKDAGSPIYFVSVLTGSDNNSSYTYLGCIKNATTSNPVYVHGVKSPIGATAESNVVFSFVWNFLIKGQICSAMEIWHEGMCCRCGRKLTTPESIAAGIGPECMSHKEKATKRKVATTNTRINLTF